MSELSDEVSEDPWAWLHTIDQEAPPDYSAFHVVAGVFPTGSESAAERCREAVENSEARVGEIRDGLAGDAEGDWFWVLPDDAEPLPGALVALLERVRREPDSAVVGSLLIEPRRRGAGTMVSDWAQTISGGGRLRPLTEPGELYQGQLNAVAALGVPAAGMLVRGDVWRFLDGLNPDLPRSHQGLDFGWRANLAGYRVVAEPAAQVIDHSPYGDPAEDLAAGMALVSGNARASTRWLTSLRLVFTCLFTALGYLLGKDPRRAGEELSGLWHWLAGRQLRHSVVDRLATLPVTPTTSATTRSLRPGRGTAIRRSAEQIAARLADWVQSFVGRGAGVSLDEMTGDDFAHTGATRQKLPVAIVGLLVLGLAALGAARSTFGTGSLTGTLLLAAPDSWIDLMSSYLAPVAGTSQVAGAPWVGLTGLLSLLTLGHPEWLVTVAFVLAVPLSWVAAFRLLRNLVSDRRLAALGALGYSLGAALIGGLNEGAFGVAALSLLLPVLGYSAWRWLAGGEWSWRRAGSVAFGMLLACALMPLFWVLALAVGVLTAARARRVSAWLQWLLVLASPLLMLIGPWGQTVLRYPGRLLTGVEPQLAAVAPAEPWMALIGHSLPGSPPLWVSLVFFAMLWLVAAAGAARKPRVAAPALVAAAVAASAAAWLPRLAVELPAGSWSHPMALEWQLLLVAALVGAACAGLDGVATDLQGRDLGLRHAAGLGLAVVCAGALLIGTGWWIIAGQSGVVRSSVGDVPPFVRNAQVSPTPGRTLALEMKKTGEVHWALLEADFARLGDAERGLAFAGDPAAHQLAGSVAARLIGDNADDQVLPDLITLGVSNVTLARGTPAQRLSISNVPGLEVGSGDQAQYVWPVPDSAIAVVAGTATRTPAGRGVAIQPGDAGRVLRIAEPPDPRRVVRVNGVPLASADGGAPGAQYALGTASGTLEYGIDQGSWWQWVQLIGLAFLAVLAAPSVRRRSELLGPRRIAEGAE